MRKHGRRSFSSSLRACAAAVAVALLGGAGLAAVAPAAGAAVHALGAATTTALDTGATAVAGGPITLTATVDCGATVPTGSVDFFVNGNATAIGTSALDGTGTATFDASTSFAAAGNFTLHATYAGDVNCAGSTSANAGLALSLGTSAVNVRTGTFRTLGFPIPLEADVTCGAVIPTGSVNFFETGVVAAIGNVALDPDGVAVLDLTSSITDPGNHTYHAVYSGDALCATSTSPDKKLVVLPNDPIERYVDFVYQYLFGRTSDPGGLEYWVGLIRGGTDRGALGWALVNSEEHRDAVIESTFQKYLGRDVDPAGKAYFLGQTGLGHSFLEIDLTLISSQEYYTLAGGTNASFVTAMFGDLLGRAPDPTGKAYFVHLLDTGTSRSGVAGGILFSQEYLSKVVDGLYLGILGRHTDAGGQAYWVGQVQRGMPLQVLVALLVGSDELFTNETGIHV